MAGSSKDRSHTAADAMQGQNQQASEEPIVVSSSTQKPNRSLFLAWLYIFDVRQIRVLMPLSCLGSSQEQLRSRTTPVTPKQGITG